MRGLKFKVYVKHLNSISHVERIDFDIKTVEVQGDVLRYNFDEVVFMQYTGLRDMNGVEIYEGDVLKDKKKNLFKVIYKMDVGGYRLVPINNVKTSYLSFNVGTVMHMKINN